ncbi:reverse transcriptase domain-containing protein [Tanacetum coccineum]
MLSCYASSPLHLLEPLSDGWIDFHQEPLIHGISLKRPLSKGIAHRPKPLSNLKKSKTSSKKGPISGMTPAQALTAIHTMADHSQKWHDGSSSRNVDNSSNADRITAIVNKLENLGRDMKKLKENVHDIQVESDEVNSSPDQCKSVYTNKEAPLNNASPKVSSVYTKYSQNEGTSSRVLLCQLPPKESNPRNFTLSCTIGSLNFYAMADLGASVNVIPKSMFKHLKLAGLTKTDMLVELADTTKRTPIGIVEKMLVKINKFLFPSDFVVMDMLNTRNETMILGRPFLATIHARIDVFNKEISLGIEEDRVAFDMNKKTHNFKTPIGEIYMINSTSDNEYTSHTLLDASSRFEEISDLHNENNYERGRIKYGETQEKELIWDDRFEEWRNNNPSPDTPTSRFTTVQENLNPKPKDYPFKDWLLTKERKAICLMTYGKIARKCKGIIPVGGMIKNQKRRKGDNLKSTEEYDPPMVHSLLIVRKEDLTCVETLHGWVVGFDEVLVAESNMTKISKLKRWFSLEKNSTMSELGEASTCLLKN